MHETVELRVDGILAQRFLSPDEGRDLGNPELTALVGPSVRKLVLDTQSDRCNEIRELARVLLHEHREYLYAGWYYHRSYTRAELASADLLQVFFTGYFEPIGEACGTIYDYSKTCQFCGAGRVQNGDLKLDLRKAPKNKDFATTIADEWIVSQRLAELFVDHEVTGVELRPVRHKARYQDGPYTFSSYPSGRELLRLAAEAGYPDQEGDFWIWLNRPEQATLRERVTEERIAAGEKRAARRPPSLPPWYQLIVKSRSVDIRPETQLGASAFDEETDDEYRCPLGHVAGLNMISELFAARDTWDGG